MNIVCSPDDNYIKHCAVMLRSLHDSNPSEDLNIYLVHGAIDQQQRATLAAYLSTLFKAVSFIQVDPSILDDLPLSRHLSIATYYKLLLPVVLPLGIEKAIYLDCDLLVADCLSPLWHTPLAQHPVGAVIDRSQAYHRDRLQLPSDSAYFNAGVLLIDLEAWRQRDILHAGIDLALKKREILDYHDQDVLNCLLQAECLHLDPRWNALPHLWGMNCNVDEVDYPSAPMALAARDHPAIIHFAGSGPAKPWNHHCNHPWKRRYLDIKKQTPWRHVPSEDQPPPWAVRWYNGALFRAKCMIKKGLLRKS